MKARLTEKYFSEIYSKYNNKIYNLAYCMTGNEEKAKDITQEAFIKVLNNYNQYKVLAAYQRDFMR